MGWPGTSTGGSAGTTSAPSSNGGCASLLQAGVITAIASETQRVWRTILRSVGIRGYRIKLTKGWSINGADAGQRDAAGAESRVRQLEQAGAALRDQRERTQAVARGRAG